MTKYALANVFQIIFDRYVMFLVWSYIIALYSCCLCLFWNSTRAVYSWTKKLVDSSSLCSQGVWWV